ncbi:MAG: MASE1 domain-containing protein, partial [Lysobacteraceae bacterium]
MRKAYRQGTRFIVLVGLYLAGMTYSARVANGSGDFALLWPSAGVAFAAVVRYGLRWVVFVPVALLLGYLIRKDVPASFLLVSILANTVAPLAAGWVVRRRPRPEFPEFRSGLWMLLGGILLSLTGATIGTAGMLFSGLVNKSQIIDAMLRWAMGDLLGVIAITPALMLLAYRNTSTPGFGSPDRARLETETMVWNIALVLSFLLMAWGAASNGSYPLGLTSLPLVVIVWSALRFTPLRTAVAVFLTIVLIGSFNSMGLGGFPPPVTTIDSVVLLSYLCVLGVLPLTLALVVNEGRVATRKMLAQATTDSLTGLSNRT